MAEIGNAPSADVRAVSLGQATVGIVVCGVLMVGAASGACRDPSAFWRSAFVAFFVFGLVGLAVSTHHFWRAMR